MLFALLVLVYTSITISISSISINFHGGQLHLRVTWWKLHLNQMTQICFIGRVCSSGACVVDMSACVHMEVGQRDMRGL